MLTIWLPKSEWIPVEVSAWVVAAPVVIVAILCVTWVILRFIRFLSAHEWRPRSDIDAGIVADPQSEVEADVDVDSDAGVVATPWWKTTQVQRFYPYIIAAVIGGLLVWALAN